MRSFPSVTPCVLLLLVMLTRRQLINHLVAASAVAVALPGSAQVDAQAGSQASARPLRFLLNKTVVQPMSAGERFRLSRAVLDFLEANYRGKAIAFWQQPFDQIDFEKRITNIVYWVDLALQQHQDLYSVDALWVMAQIMAESLFCELAISPSLAAGICQFMPATAVSSYQMVIAGSLPSHHQFPYVATELAGSLDQYRQLIQTRDDYLATTREQPRLNLDDALQLLAEGKPAQAQAQAQLERDAKLRDLTLQISRAQNNYVTFIQTNVESLGKNDIFGQTQFFTGFDERLTYQKPIYAMVHMLANALRVRNGNILAAATAYNAGLRRTWTNEAIYSQYGFLPGIEETSRYVSRTLANYEEIALRFYR